MSKRYPSTKEVADKIDSLLASSELEVDSRDKTRREKFCPSGDAEIGIISVPKQLDLRGALDIAQQKVRDLTFFEEYQGCFVFSQSDAESFGGGGQPIVIIKGTGKALNFVSALGEGLLDGGPISAGDVNGAL